MRTIWLSILWGLFALGLAAPRAAFPAGEPGPLLTIRSLDVPRYTGRWYEIAKYPNRFQRQCLSDTTADYRLQSDGSLRVVNRCRLQDGRFVSVLASPSCEGSRNRLATLP